MTDLKKIDNFFNNQNISELKNVSLFKTSTGYELFYRYNIDKTENVFKVSNKFNFTIKYFSSLINAFSYCVFDHRNKIQIANAIENLDTSVQSLNFEIKRLNHLLTKKIPISEKLIYSAKLSESVIKLKQVNKEMSFHVNKSIEWQKNQFNLKN